MAHRDHGRELRRPLRRTPPERPAGLTKEREAYIRDKAAEYRGLTPEEVCAVIRNFDGRIDITMGMARYVLAGGQR